MKVLSTQELESRMADDMDFIGVFALDRMPRQVAPGKCKLIVNLQYANLPGNHWIAIYRNEDGVGYYYDSFGRLPPLEALGWLAKNCATWTWNTKTLQKLSDTVSCGYLCINFLKHV